MVLSRRRFARVLFLGGIAATGVGGAAAIVNYLYPRNADHRPPQDLLLKKNEIPAPGDPPLLNKEFGIYLYNLSNNDAGYSAHGVEHQGLVAFSTKCPHIAGECPVRWSATFTFNNPGNGQHQRGWFVCPCHGSTFTRYGERVFGPARHGLDTFRITRKDNGDLDVHLTDVIEGTKDSAPEPLPWPT